VATKKNGFPKAESSPHLDKYFCGDHQADRRPAVKLSPKEASKGGYRAERAFARPMTGEDFTARLKIYSKGDGQAMRRASPRCPARQPERLSSKTATFDRAARQQRFGHHSAKP